MCHRAETLMGVNINTSVYSLKAKIQISCYPLNIVRFTFRLTICLKEGVGRLAFYTFIMVSTLYTNCSCFVEVAFVNS